MNGWCQLVLGHAALTALAAVLVAGLTRVWRNPNLAHVLWALVLVKLVTPPLALAPLPALIALAARSGAEALSASAAAVGERKPEEAGSDWLAGPIGSGGDFGDLTAGEAREPAEGDSAAGPPAPRRAGYEWPRALAVVWLTGTALWIGLFAARVLRFQRVVRATPAAPEAWQQELAALAARLELRTWPKVRLVDGAIPPLLWSVGGGPVILLPQPLAGRLESAGRRALLAHELCHFYRRDHWMRWLEMMVLAVWWWNPVAWWAHRRLRVAEEECCDAWAVWLLDGASRLYGRALLTTIEFLCQARSTAPLGASGIGQSGSCKKRFEMILEQPFGRRLSVSTWLAIVPLAIVVLSVSLCFSPVGGLWSARPMPSGPALVRGDAASVELDGKLYEVVSIDDLPASKILETAREHHGVFWEKRFAENLVEDMDRLGHRPGETVTLVVRDPASGDARTIRQAAIRGESRLKIYAAAHNDQIQTVPHALAWAKLSPFTTVHIRPDIADVAVEFEGQVYFLVSIDDLPTHELLAGSRRYDGRRWVKRFAEDLVEVMDHMGHRPGETVKLVLRDAESGEIKTIARAPMTAENRAKVYATRFANLPPGMAPGAALPERSPFTQVRVHGEAADVEFEGKFYQLVSIDNLPTEEILDASRQYWGNHWEARFAEHLVDVLDRLGHPAGDTVKLVLRDPESGQSQIVRRAPLTEENYSQVYAAAHPQLAQPPPRARAKLSPFTAVRVVDEAAEVEFDGQSYELVSIDDVPIEEILQGARRCYGSLGSKRFVEDLAEVMDRLGHPTGATVKLVLGDPRSDENRVVEQAPMTAENGVKVHAAAHAEPTGGDL